MKYFKLSGTGINRPRWIARFAFKKPFSSCEAELESPLIRKRVSSIWNATRYDHVRQDTCVPVLVSLLIPCFRVSLVHSPPCCLSTMLLSCTNCGCAGVIDIFVLMGGGRHAQPSKSKEEVALSWDCYRFLQGTRVVNPCSQSEQSIDFF